MTRSYYNLKCTSKPQLQGYIEIAVLKDVWLQKWLDRLIIWSTLLNHSPIDISRLLPIRYVPGGPGKHCSRLGLTFSAHRRSCKKTVLHLQCACSALANKNHKYMVNYILDIFSEISNMNINNILIYLRATGWI